MILDSIFGIFDSISGLFGSAYLQYGILAVGAIILGFKYFKDQSTHKHEVLYFAEQEKTGLQLKVTSESPRLVKTEKNMRFLRNKVAYNFRLGKRVVTRYLGKRGTAYTFELENGMVKKVGSIYDAVCVLWGQDRVDKLKSEELKKLKESTMFITVDLERGLTPSGSPPMSESDINTESNLSMANLIGKAIRDELATQDFVKVLALIGTGAGVIFLLEALGIISI